MLLSSLKSYMNSQKTFWYKLFHLPTYQFWALNIFGWSGYYSFQFLGAMLWDEGHDIKLRLGYGIAAALSGFILSLAIRRFFQWTWPMPPLQKGIYSLLCIILISAVWSAMKWYSYHMMMEIVCLTECPDWYEKKIDRELTLGEFLGWYTYSFFILLSWGALYFGIKFYQALQLEKQRLLAVTATAHQAQLKMLRYQLNPHFLFNTLNAISTLILEVETKTANSMVTGLSRFLRYSLENDPMQKVSMAQELEALKLYLDIEKVRFEDRLNLNMKVDESAKEALIPSLLLQPLVENSIKYAVSKSETGGTINLLATRKANRLHIEVSDDGPGMAMEDGLLPKFNGVGLQNFVDRLKTIYGESHTCQFSNLKPHGLHVSIDLPFESAATGV